MTYTPVKRLLTRIATVAELFVFAFEHRLWWMIPVLVALLLIGLLLLSAQVASVGRFVYPL